MESTRSDLLVFSSGFRADGADAWIGRRLQAELPGIQQQLFQSTASGICPLADVGTYWMRVLQVLSQFANTIAYGSFIHEHVTSQLHTLLEEDDGTISDYLDSKHDALKTFANELNTATNTCIRLWQESPDPAVVLPAHTQENFSQQLQRPPASDHPETYLDPAGIPTIPDLSRTESEQTGSTMDIGRTSISSESTPPEQVTSFSEQLKNRGTGLYTCSHGLECKKGGVLPDGTLKVFKRNSDFRAHMSKHEKMFKCDLPGCINKKGFARLDQLERHKKDVKHITSPWVSERISG